MFSRANFESLMNAIEIYTTSDEGNMMAGLKQNLFSLLKKTAEEMESRFYMQ